MTNYYDSDEEKEPSLKDKVDETYSILKSLKEKDKRKLRKKLKVPRRAKVSKSKMKKGYTGILFLNENRTISGEKVKLDGGTYKTKDDNYHVTDGHELVFWDGKFPILWQRYDKLNPTNLFAKEGDENEIYGQDMIMLRMKRDLIKEKKKGGGMSWIWLLVIGVAGYFVLKMFFPKIFGG